MPSRRRHRDRRPGRRPPFRDPKPIVLIICEGERSEPEYLEGFARACRNSRVRIEIASEHGAPRILVATAKDLKKRSEAAAKREGDENLAYDAVWCVFDVDEHPQIADARQMARDNGIELAISNPCFELWLLLHFRESPGMQHRARICELLSGHVPGYDKRVEFASYSAGYPQAVKRAEQMDQKAQEVGEPGRNPTTGVYRLTEAIREE